MSMKHDDDPEQREDDESRQVLSPIPQACATPTTCTVPLNKPLKPLFPPTYRMNESTIVMPCNDGETNGGWLNATFFGSFGIADYDWSNAKAYAGICAFGTRIAHIVLPCVLLNGAPQVLGQSNPNGLSGASGHPGSDDEESQPEDKSLGL